MRDMKNKLTPEECLKTIARIKAVDLDKDYDLGSEKNKARHEDYRVRQGNFNGVYNKNK